jgi:hypothetical protein
VKTSNLTCFIRVFVCFHYSSFIIFLKYAQTRRSRQVLL